MSDRASVIGNGISYHMNGDVDPTILINLFILCLRIMNKNLYTLTDAFEKPTLIY